MESLNASPVGPWTNDELDALIDNYLLMLHTERAGLPVNKAQFNRDLRERITRNRASIEFKHCNLSSVLQELGKSYIDGYKPRDHYQAALRDRVLLKLHHFPDQLKQQLPENVIFPKAAPSHSIPPSQRSDSTIQARQDDALQVVGNNDGSISHNNQPPSGILDFEEVAATVQPTNDPSIANFWSGVMQLWDRATGGADVAARPLVETNREEPFPVAPRPAGVEEACEWFEQGISTSPVPRILLLVGGPGAGKSHASERLVRNLKRTGPVDDGLAHRRYDYISDVRNIILINDATIPSDVYATAPLGRELQEALETESHVIACVNRGILVEEIATLSDSESTCGQQLLRWVAGERAAENKESDWQLIPQVEKEYFSSAHLKQNDQLIAEVVVVYVDVCSLLERRPIVELDSSEQIENVGNYAISGFGSRFNWSTDTSSAGVLMNSIVEQLANYPDFADQSKFNPVIANIESLKSVTVRSGLLSILRAAEITSGQKFTYREMWGAVVRSIVGSLPELIDRTKISTYFHDRDEMPTDKTERFRIMQRTGDFRLSQSIFGIENLPKAHKVDPRRNPVTRLTSAVDPMRDAVPGKKSTDTESGWADPVTEAFSGPAVLDSPLKNLEDSLPKDDPFHAIITEFDRNLDGEFCDTLRQAGLKDADRYRFIHWYGAYIGRLYAVANGIPAFRREVALWTSAWSSSPILPPQLGAGLRTLLRPKRRPGDTQSTSLIPILDSRTNPISGSQTQPKIALRMGDVDMKTEREAESLFLVLSEHGREIARVPLDFPLVRESTVCGDDYPGMTELTETTSPRLERFRAARLVPIQLSEADYVLVDGDNDEMITIERGAYIYDGSK